ncbi:DUF4174 domain-containing protein [Nostocaceae cyanobacterium CENA357]|uniref:DUF4174 domain-containing protein n=1 Tax=Atlanticothrix silvestris CENA357 TaxID=1725252 RepID=A0A8J7HFY4_9CYAN|nr:DUF4174 domain-containing protein [Atlanticothrix silvestris]MBH8551856.1 DUF4174 domain-containing protein [Atlanticothrix silvestris CENA357]
MLIRSSILALLLIYSTGCSTFTQFFDRGSGRVKISSAAFVNSPETKPTANFAVDVEDNNMAFNLNSYQWKNRLLLVFAPSETSDFYQRQMQLFEEQKAGFPERDLVVVEMFTEGAGRAGEKTLDEADVAQMQKQFNIAPQEFRTILIGKDGKSKRSDSYPVKPEVIFQEIDAMPMRQQEIRDREALLGNADRR